MMKCALIGALGLLAACGNSESKQEPASRSSKVVTEPQQPVQKTDPACVAKTKELESWLAQHGVEIASHEIDWGVTLPTLDRTATPLSRTSDWISITEKTTTAYDATTKSVSGADAPTRTPKEIADRLAQMHSTPPPPDEADASPVDQLRVNIDEKTPWTIVVRTIDAATKAGYTELRFAFATTTKLQPPAGVEPVSTSHEVVSQASRALEALQEKCPAWERSVLRHKYVPDRAENARAVARETAAALAECNCAVDPEELKRLTWQGERWHQAKMRTSLTVKLVGDGAATLSIAGTRPWSEAHKQLAALAPEGATPVVKFVVNK